MNRAMGRLGLVMALGCGWLGGCGDGDGSSSSGVSGGKLLTELSKDDNTKLCRFYEKLYKDSLGTEEQ